MPQCFLIINYLIHFYGIDNNVSYQLSAFPQFSCQQKTDLHLVFLRQGHYPKYQT